MCIQEELRNGNNRSCSWNFYFVYVKAYIEYINPWILLKNNVSGSGRPNYGRATLNSEPKPTPVKHP